MKFAFIQNDAVVLISEFSSEDEAMQIARTYQAVIDITNLDPQPEVNWQLINGVLIDPTGESQPSKKISKLKFAQRFTDTELAGIESYAWQATPTAAALRASLRKQMIAQFIDLSLPETTTGLLGLVALGLISADRANVILTTPVTDAEKYTGSN